MKLDCGEQIGNSRHFVRVNGRVMKTISSRKMRRLGKQLLDEAPPKPRYDGWAA